MKADAQYSFWNVNKIQITFNRRRLARCPHDDRWII